MELLPSTNNKDRTHVVLRGSGLITILILIAVIVYLASRPTASIDEAAKGQANESRNNVNALHVADPNPRIISPATRVALSRQEIVNLTLTHFSRSRRVRARG